MSLDHFLVRRPGDLGSLPIEGDSLRDEGIREVWSVALANIESAYRVLRLPFEVALTCEWVRQKQEISHSQYIVARTLEVQSKLAKEEIHEFVKKETNRIFSERQPEAGEPYAGFNSAVSALDLALKAFGLEDSAAKLRLQTVVQAWSAVEVAARDTFSTLLNTQPLLVRSLQADAAASKRFQLKKLDLELFLEHGFDLSGRLGDILLRQADVDSLPALSDVFRALLPDAEPLHRALASRELHLLAQRRHVIVHHAGTVTAAYLRITGDQADVGSHLVVSPEQADQSLTLAQNTIALLVQAADDTLARAT